MSNKLTTKALEILEIERDLPSRLNYRCERIPTIDDFEIYIFDQVWGSTALGFSGIGGQTITRATTYVFIPEDDAQYCFVYFAGEFAYQVPYSRAFMEDVQKQCMEPVSKFGKYIESARCDL